MWKSGALRIRRHDALAEMVRLADHAASYAEPWARTPRIWEFYKNESDILRELHQQWRTDLAGTVFVAIEQGQGDLAADVSTAYAETGARLGGVRKILDEYAEHPAIAAAVRKERALLGAIGRATVAA
jgi:hypothetical protein